MNEAELLRSFEDVEDIRRFVSKYEARDDLVKFAKYIYPGFEDPPHIQKIAKALQEVEAGENRRLMVYCPPRHGKAISHDTLVPTPEGFRKHGDLGVGDFVFGLDGCPTRIVAVSEDIMVDRRVHFSDGSFIDCHENHEWLVFDRARVRKSSKKDPLRVLETKDLEKRKLLSSSCSSYDPKYMRCNLQLPKRPQVQYPEKELPIHPYFFGAWLGDGYSSNPLICCHESDIVLIYAINQIGYANSPPYKNNDTGVYNFYFKGLRKPLRELGVLSDGNKKEYSGKKHIPEIYRRSSVEQRLQLLAGLIDADGSVGRDGRVAISNTNEDIINGSREVIESLGFRTSVSIGTPKDSGGILTRKDCFILSFWPDIEIPTRIPRKKISGTCKNRRVGFKEIEIIPEHQGKCIQVDNKDGMYLVGKEYTPTHNSLLCSQIFPVWFLGRDPKREILCVSYNNDYSLKFGRKSRALVRSEEFKEVFPGISVSSDSKAADNWELKYVSIERGRERIRDGGVFQAAGIEGEVTGKGANLILIDDPVKGRANADSEAIRNSTWNFYESDLYSRQLAGCAIVLIQTRWHEDDLGGRLLHRMQEGGEQWKVIEFPAILDKEETLSLWPEKFPIEEMLRYRETMAPRTWQSLYMQSPVSDEGNIIKRAWWEPWADDSGRDKPLPEFFDFVLVSVDTAYTLRDHGSYSAITVWGIHKLPNKTPCILLLDAWRDRVEYPELRAMVMQYNDNWNPDAIVVEKKASGQSISQDLKRLLLPIVDFKPDKDKMTRAQSAASMIQAGLVYYVRNRFTEKVIDECASFPTGKHDDLVDTMSQALIVIRENNYLNTRKLYRDYDDLDDLEIERRPINYY